MMDAINYFTKAAAASTIGACCMTGVATANFLRLVRCEAMMLAFPFHRRADELHTGDLVPATGASWFDHYGKRSHDVDVEKMR